MAKVAATLLFCLAALGLGACQGNLIASTLTPVPPVHQVPEDLRGAIILVAEDPIIETHDPVHIARAKERRIPQDYRESMVRALGLAGFRVVASKDQPYDLAAKLALRVSEDDGTVRQTYRCGLRAPDGTEVAQIDWAWPQGVYVDGFEVLDFATHHVATEIATSRLVAARLRALRPPPPPPPKPPSE